MMDVFTVLIEDKTFLSVNFMVKALKVKLILITLYFMNSIVILVFHSRRAWCRKNCLQCWILLCTKIE